MRLKEAPLFLVVAADGKWFPVVRDVRESLIDGGQETPGQARKYGASFPDIVDNVVQAFFELTVDNIVLCSKMGPCCDAGVPLLALSPVLHQFVAKSRLEHSGDQEDRSMDDERLRSCLAKAIPESQVTLRTSTGRLACGHRYAERY
jgi:hypothetical protein